MKLRKNNIILANVGFYFIYLLLQFFLCELLSARIKITAVLTRCQAWMMTKEREKKNKLGNLELGLASNSDCLLDVTLQS